MVTLRDYQQETADAFVDKLRLGGGLEPGLGKTITTLSAISRIRDRQVSRPFASRWLVAAPLSVIHSAWMKDSAHFPHMRVMSLWDKSKELIQKKIKSDRWDVGVLNLEQIKLRIDDLKLAGIGHLVIDESSKVANPGTKQSEVMYNLAMSCDSCFLLSGNPAPNDLTQWFHQTQIISRGQAFSIGGKPMNQWQFARMYFWQKEITLGTGRKVKVGRPVLLKHREDAFWDIVKKYWIIKRKSDVGNLPPKIEMIREVEMSTTERRVYNELKHQLKTEIGNQKIGVTQMAALMKLRQVTSGFMYSGGTVHSIGTSKLNELLDLIEGDLAGKKVVVWTTFREEAARVCEALAKHGGAVQIIGGMSPDDRMASIRSFVDGDAKFMVANPAAAGHGTDGFQKVCSDVVFFSSDYSWDTHSQAMDRTHRIGMAGACMYYHLICPGTVDSAIYNTLQSKGEMTDLAKSILAD